MSGAWYRGGVLLFMFFCNTARRVFPSTFVLAGLGLLGLSSARLSFAQGVNAWALASADFDADGKADLVVSQPGQLGVSIFLSNGQTIDIPLDFAPAALAAGDVNGDGKPDLVVAAPGYVAVLLANGDGTFRDAAQVPTADATLSLAAGDLNGDGRADIVVLGARQRTSVFLSNADGSMQPPVSYALGQIPTAVAVGDFNHDGRLDLVVADAGTNQVLLALGNGDGTFQSASGYAAGPLPRSLAVGDFNGDGIADVAVSGLGDGNVRILLGTAWGTLKPGEVYDAGIGWTSIIAADLAGRRTLDLVWANSNTGALSTLSGRGDGTFSTSRPLMLTATPRGGMASTTTTLTTSPSGSAIFGQQVTLTATISFSSATGKVTFYDGTEILGISSVSSGHAILKTTLIPAGSNPLTALYSGDSIFSSSRSSTVPLSVTTKVSGPLTPAGGSPYNVSSVPEWMAVGDFNGDGNPDLAIVDSGTRTGNILLGNGIGGFTAGPTFPTGSFAVWVAVGDFNGDGKQDLAVANAGDNTVSILLGNGSGGFSLLGSPIMVGTTPSSIAVADFNRDGKADLAVANDSGSSVTVLLGNGDGTFAAATGSPVSVGSQPIWVGTGDFNGDGIPDLVVANFGVNNVTVLLGNGNGSFNTPGTTLAAGTGPQGGVVGDFNGDGEMDFAVANGGSGNITVFFGNGSGTSFTTLTVGVGTNPDSIAVGDFNGDGNLDLAVANAGQTGAGGPVGNVVTILLGNGSGGFTPASFSPTAGSNPIAVVVGDFNNDGRADLAVENLVSSNVSVFLGNVALGFFPLASPCRMIDTRGFGGKNGTDFGPPALMSSVSRDFPLLQSGCGISLNALAYSTNVTVSPNSSTLQFLSAWPAGQPYPNVSTLNSPKGNVIANAAILPGGTSGAVTFLASDMTDLIVDANGYFAPPNGPEMLFFPITPCRIADTRPGHNTTYPYGPPSLTGSMSRDIPIAGNCQIPANAQAFSLNITASPTTGTLDFLSIWPAGQSYPNVSTLNSPDGSVIANAAIVSAGTNGSITVLAGKTSDVIIDANGYFSTTGANGLHFYPMTPCRAVDTRSDQHKTGAFGPPPLAANTSRDFPIQSSACNVPPTAQAYSLNITASPNGPVLDFLSIWQAGQPYPNVSTLNSPKGAVIANAAIVPAGSQGKITVLAAEMTDLIIDINGYFAP